MQGLSAKTMSEITMKRQVLLFISVISFCSVVGQVSYSIPEEMSKGFFVGNIAQDLGLDVKRLNSGKARVFTRDSAEYIELNRETGVLLIKERIDREALCGLTTPCALHCQIILENPMEFYSINIEITDINDNPPTFVTSDIHFNISEFTLSGTTFILDRAIDLDVGENGLKTYILKPSGEFSLKMNNQIDTSKNVEMVLHTPLDREENDQLSLVLMAADGGEPQMTGTMQIHITVLDANDNAPVFTQSVYKASIKEDAPEGTVVLTVTATDADRDSNGRITYSISSTLDHASGIFEINKESGDIKLVGKLDYEKSGNVQINIRASDGGGLTGSCKVIVDILDINDNKPDIHIMSKSNVISEDAKRNTVVTMINVEDADSGENGKVHCSITDNIYFILKSTSNRFYNLLTDDELDRERASEYNITVTCSDEGVPSLSSSVTLTLQISDVNDNAPVFERSSYEAYIVENNTPGLSIFTVKARETIRQVTDKDAVKQRLTVIVEDNGQPSRSVTVVVNVAVADSFPEVLSEFTDFTHDKEYNDNLTFYLVLALAVVSFLFITCLVVIISVKIYRWRQSRILYHSNLPVIPYYPPRYSDTLGTGTLQHVYNYEVCRTTDSRRSDCKFGRAGSQNVLIMDPSSTGTMQRIQNEKSILDEPDSPLEVRIC
ncbi:protocadherin beta-14-like [Seriola lalandi dorsalis]|uniref:protocadherin beta-14-like n=1 Tax=Seriola lalandi dorsalis TaxID=1841481 RepID=UPI000C6F660A|nr:protocadherin beta-14-like [Seriola lalandi dorsalis]